MTTDRERERVEEILIRMASTLSVAYNTWQYEQLWHWASRLARAEQRPTQQDFDIEHTKLLEMEQRALKAEQERDGLREELGHAWQSAIAERGYSNSIEARVERLEAALDRYVRDSDPKGNTYQTGPISEISRDVARRSG